MTYLDKYLDVASKLSLTYDTIKLANIGLWKTNQ